METNNSDDWSQLSKQFCNCYKVSSLSQTVLGATQISNLSDRYVLGKQLGWGQFGVIRECSDKFTGEVLACKSIAKDRLVSVEDVRSIKLEIEIMTKLSGHPNVVDLKAVYEEENYVHLLMELCAGGELFHRLEKCGKFSEIQARGIFRHLIHVVKYCHDNGVVHRDLKPENILLTTKTSSSPIKLADFGLATYIKPGQNLHGTVGSPFYIAPEVLAGGYNQAADLWSAGVILYILLSGMPPFCGKTKSKIFDAVRAADLRFPSDPWEFVSASAKDLIMGILHLDPSKRLTASEVLAHPWMEDSEKVSEELCKQDDFCGEQLEAGGSSLSATFISRNGDYSFNDGQLEQSPAFTCKSSFSAFLTEESTPCSEYGGFSCRRCCESSSVDFSSPLPSMPSFTFFSRSPAVEQGNASFEVKVNTSILDYKHGESNMRRLCVLLDSLLPIRREVREEENKTEVRRGGTTCSRVSGMHSKRNHTIGLGELDLMVTESVIRWASCTQIPTAPSLRLSFIC